MLEDEAMRRRRKQVFGALTVLLVLAAVEAASFLLLCVSEQRLLTHGRLRARQLAVAGVEVDEGSDADGGPALDLPRDLGNEVVHPYLGFVLDPGLHSGNRRAAGGREALDFGFVLGEPDIFHPPSAERPVVAITGGSMAFRFGLVAGGELRDEFLGGLPGFERAVVVNLALPGYKQPQQLIALGYFLALGAHFDLVLNLDGFNEVALPPSENLTHGVFPFFPRNWYFRAQDLDASLRLAVGELAYLEARRRRTAAGFAAAPYRYSLTSGLVWTVLDRDLRRSLSERERELRREREQVGESFTVTGPRWEERDEEATYRELVAVWARASEQMHHLLAGHGGRYHHFLQPNQYLDGSKPMAKEERRTSVHPDHPYGRHAAKAYPLLVEHGRTLVDRGVRYTDLTTIFAEVEEPVYRDLCCHLNETGQRLLVRAIAAAIRDDLEAAARSGTRRRRGP